MTTIKDVARIAGVSPTTVSNVLHGRTGKVSAEKLGQVQRAIQATNYTSNMAARMLTKRSSRIIGVIIHSATRLERPPMQDPFFSVILGALEENIRTNGYFMMMYTSAHIEESLRMAAGWDVDGLVALGCNDDACEELFSSAATPVVFIDSYYKGTDGRYFNVGLRDRAGAHEMARHLIGQGHRSIAFLASAKTPVGVDHERYMGVLDALAESGIPCAGGENYVAISHNMDQRHALLREKRDELLQRYSALFFASDLYAADAIGVLGDMGVNVPGDISVCGFDGNMYSTVCRPTLTTVRQDVPQKAQAAVELLTRLIAGEAVEDNNLLLDSSLCVRNSTRAVAPL